MIALLEGMNLLSLSMPSKKKLIVYFSLAGVLPVLFFTAKDLVEGTAGVIDASYFQRKLVSIVVACTTNGLISAAVMFLPIAFLEKTLPWVGNWIKRFLAEIFLTELTALAAMVGVIHLFWATGYHDFSIGSDAYWSSLTFNLFITVVMNLVLVSIYEGITLFSYWKKSLIQNEKLEKENAASKFEALKNQVNPHFLFNSLNTLSNLVHEDAHKAEDFIDEFSHIYRYILEKQDQSVVSVEEEIAFVKSYLTLCKIRFGQGLQSDIHLDGDKLELMIPTLALQTLVENAIKHNKITKQEPLTISIYNDNSYLTVENNYQPRPEKSPSTGIGLRNIKERYQMLSSAMPTFAMHNDSYIAKLPLIQPI